MVLRLPLDHERRAEALDALIASSRETVSDVAAEVSAIIDEVRHRGDAALLALTCRLDGRDVDTMSDLSIGGDALAAAYERLPQDLRDALVLAVDRITRFHECQQPVPLDWKDETGIRLGLRYRAVDAAGLYVPGGKAAYPSSVLMNAVPAKVAGVERLVLMTPAPQGDVSAAVLAAAHLVGVDEVWTIGGAQAIAALAYGTATIAPVDKITGPGNAYVAAAKKQVFGQVGIDSIAGPSEVVIMADAANEPDWIAADLMAQAEHDELAQAILITDHQEFGDKVAAAVERLLPKLSRHAIAGASWQNHGAIITVADWDEGAALVNRLAPEHLQIALADAEAVSLKIRHAGAIFLGAYTPEAIGDYVAGPNHVLPTSRTARFSSGLGVADFIKRTTVVGCDSASLPLIGKAATVLAEAEGLDAHALSVMRRLDHRL